MENKKCPLCGIRDMDINESPYVANIDLHCRYRVFCFNCGTCGPERTTKESAWQAWNTRPEEDRLNAEVERLKGIIHNADDEAIMTHLTTGVECRDVRNVLAKADQPLGDSQ